MQDQQDYTTSGFDKLLSRGDIPNLSGSLDTQGTVNNAVPFDRTQVSGSQGDTYKMGGILMAAKDNSITLNDGQIIVNDTNTNNTINASSGNITYNDSSGNTVIQEGVLPDNTTGIRALDTQGRTVAQLGRFKDDKTGFRILDTSGIGIAQFGQFPDGSVALKIAKAGIEVATALDSQLVFNSAQNIFKIVQTGTASLVGSGSLGAGLSQTVTIPHNLGFTPAHMVFTNSPAYCQFFNLNGGIMPLPVTYILSNPLNWLGTRADTINLYIDLTNVTGSTQNLTSYSWTFTYYIYQETAN